MRALQRVLSALLALVLLAGGVLALVTIVAAVFYERPWPFAWDDLRDDATATPWMDRDPMRLIFILLMVAGLILLVVPFLRRKPTAIPLAAQVQGSEAELDRRGLESWLNSRFERVDGVARARTQVRGRQGKRVTVMATTPGRDTASVEQLIRSTADSSLGQLGLANRVPVKVSVTSQRQEV